jgi:hypothetical protein
MNKQVLALVVILCVAVTIAVIFFAVAPRKAAQSSAKSGRELENSGKYDAAMSAYASALVKLTEGRRFIGIPDRTTAANLNPKTWEKPIEEFVDWLNVGKHISSQASALVDGLERCMPKVKYENYVFDVKMKKAAAADYAALWRRAFCPEANCPQVVIDRAFAQTNVIFTLGGNSIYSYAVSFVDCASGKRTDVQIDKDMTPSFLMKPGKYCCIVRSTAMFQDKREWISGREAVMLTVPDSVTVMSALLRTEVGRVAK